jgi:hypothetical protein
MFLFTKGQSIGLIRSLDDNHALGIDSNDWRVHRQLKDIALRHDPTSFRLSIGGEIREQLRYYNHINFGDVPGKLSDRDIYLQQRFMVHVDLSANHWLRFFAQIHSAHATGKEIISPQTDRDVAGIMQAFADLTLCKSSSLRLRMGRQEFLYGLERMWGLRDGATVRQTYDGLKLSFTSGSINTEAFAVVPVSFETGAFDNEHRKKEYIAGNYWMFPMGQKNTLDIYYFNARYQSATFANDTATDKRHSVGFRICRNKGSLNYDAEAVWQFGCFGSQKIGAWQLSSIISYHFQNILWQPRLSFREGIFSGDRSASDNQINTFRPITTKSPLHDMMSFGSANLLYIAPEAEFKLFPTLTFAVRYLYVKRFSTHDGVYSTDIRKRVRPSASAGQTLGTHVSQGIISEITYYANKHLILWLYYGYWFAGEYIQNTGSGKDLEALSLRVSYKF